MPLPWSRAQRGQPENRPALIPGPKPFAKPQPVETRSQQFTLDAPAAWFRWRFPDGLETAVSDEVALTLSAVWRSCALISGSCAGLPLRTLEDAEEGRRDRVSSFLDQFPDGRDGPTPFEWKEQMFLKLLLHGTTYLRHRYNGAGVLAGLQLIPSCLVNAYWDDTRPGGKRFEVSLEGDRLRTFDARTMTQIIGLSLDGLTGLNPIEFMRVSLGGSISGDKTASNALRNGISVAGMLSPRGDDTMLEKDDAKKIKQSANETMTGPENAGSIAVFQAGMQFDQVRLSLADLQFLESRTFGIDEIGRWFGVPPHLLGLTEKATSWGQGIAEQNRGLARYTLSGWTTRVEQRLTRLQDPGRFNEFDYSQFVKPSPEDEIRLLLEQVNGGLITPNEARRVRNMPPIEGGDILRIPAGQIPPGQFNQGGGNGESN